MPDEINVPDELKKADEKTTAEEIITYVIKDPLELNLSYMPFINDGGLFVPSSKSYYLGDKVFVDLKLPGKETNIRIEGKVVWVIPQNALHHVLPGVGIQFIGADTKAIREQIEAELDHSIEIGSYVYGITSAEVKK